ncbi:PA14 domain-containing protein [Bdellovibrio sp. 22V]|uniref:PA14 domain-containing protein n=1 Tax=Bdellovibrio TaxID=958 RepID=UPI0025426C5D|nr:PA14 domain-containing protein [Bdellovibrio sp. 22V]WII72863.1 PA14 domain-containing protein [Bdellovibrio sp. 22V]
MLKTLFAIAIAFSFASASDAKSSNTKSSSSVNRYQRGLLKKISCHFSGTRTSTGDSIGSVDFVDPEKTVCDPLSNTSSPSPENGLLGKLILKTPEMGNKVSSVMDYYNKGQKIDKDLFFADVNVPTRSFTQGFSTLSGEVLVGADGNKLIENFAIEYTSTLKLSENDKEGEYEIAVLSDDGARMFIKEGDKWNELINNDGNHPTRMGCPYRTITMTKNSEVPVKLLYYQGPRYHIANVLIWKHHKKAHTWKEPSRHSLCGIASNQYFYDSKNGKKKPAIHFLEATGWRTIAAANFKMPEQKPNPCSQEPLVINDFRVVSAQAPNATVAWTTNLPSSTQLRILNVYTGEEMLTEVDANLVNEHTVELSGLVHGIYYQVQAISKDAEGRETRSALINVLP